MSRETGWLIEFNDGSQPLWFCADGKFNTDSTKALRFSRKKDGEEFLASGFYMYDDAFMKYKLFGLGKENYRVTEHEWCDYGRD